MNGDIKPIVLVHGYSGESKDDTPAAATAIYGTLPKALQSLYGKDKVITINVSRFITLEDELTIDDISYGLEKALHSSDYSHLLESGFNAIDHSTGGLVMRNWIRRYSPKPSPIDHLIHLAPAHFGSGLATIGQGRIARWWRYFFQQGAEPGVKILEALEFGSFFSLELHKYFLDNPTFTEYGIKEYVLIGSEADPSWISLPIRYGHEDGSDGVVRACAANLNYRYIKCALDKEKIVIDSKLWNLISNPDKVNSLYDAYMFEEDKCTGKEDIPGIPFRVLLNCTHTGNHGIVTGDEPRQQLLESVKQALLDKDRETWSVTAKNFAAETEIMYSGIADDKPPSYLAALTNFWCWQNQYDKYAMLILRFTDQYGEPVVHYDVHLNSEDLETKNVIGDMIQHRYKNTLYPNHFVFYLRVEQFDAKSKKFICQLDKIKDCTLHITATEPGTDNIEYVPFNMRLNKDALEEFIRPNEVTLVDLQMYRVPAQEVYKIYPAKI